MGHLSSVDGTAVTDVAGVETAVADAGCWFQSTRPGRDPRTSEGLGLDSPFVS